MDKDERSLKQISHEMPFKKLILGISRVINSRTTRKTLCLKLKNLRTRPFKLATGLRLILLSKWVAKIPRKHVFHTKTIWKTLKNMGDTNHFKKQTKRTKIFLIWSTYVEHTHITFEHVQSHKWNRYSLNIRLVCCVWVSSMN